MCKEAGRVGVGLCSGLCNPPVSNGHWQRRIASQAGVVLVHFRNRNRSYFALCKKHAGRCPHGVGAGCNSAA